MRTRSRLHCATAGWSVVFVSTVFFSSSLLHGDDKRPNILFVFTDDHAYQAISAYGSRINRTPNIDRLAREGMRFDNCYVTNSICGPCRAVILTGKYRPDTPPPPSSRAGAGDARMLQVDYRDESLRLTQVFKTHAEARGMTVVDFALNWVLNSRHVASVIAGPRTAAQWRGYIGALKHPFGAEDEALVDGLVASGHPSTPGYNDPQYPPTGRQPRTG